MDSIQLIYIALFGRPADPAGLAYFAAETNNGQDLTAIGDLSATDEYQRRFAGDDDQTVIIEIYQELFGRTPSFAEVQYWQGQLNMDRFDINDIAIAIAQSAQGEDAALLEAKVAAANQFTAAVQADPEAFAAYRGPTGEAAGRTFLNQIDSSDDTLTDAQVAAQVEAIGNGTNPGGQGEIFTLLSPTVGDPNAGIDSVTGTAGDDTFRALGAGSLESADVIDGGNGFDVLNISEAAVSGGTAAPVISGIERINNDDSNSTINLSAVTGVQQVWSTGAANGDVFTYTNASLATVFGTSGAAGAANTVSIDYAGSVAGRTTALLATAASDAATTTTFDFVDATGIEAVTINATAGANTIALDADLTVLDTVNFSGAGRVTLTSVETTITTVDASANTGGVTFNAGASTAAVTATGGSGNDVLNFANATATSVVTANGGAGNDIITGGAAADVLSGGEGNDILTGGANGDTLTGGAGDDVFDYNALTDSGLTGGGTITTTVDTITDFNVGNDTIDLSGIDADAVAAGDQAFTVTSAANQIAIDNAVAALAPDATLAQAAAAAAAVTADGQVAWFTYGGDTYVQAETAGDDLLIRLTGTVALSASDFAL